MFTNVFWCDNNLSFPYTVVYPFCSSTFAWNIHLISLLLVWFRAVLFEMEIREKEESKRKLAMNENQVNPVSLWSLLLCCCEHLIYKSIPKCPPQWFIIAFMAKNYGHKKCIKAHWLLLTVRVHLLFTNFC